MTLEQKCLIWGTSAGVHFDAQTMGLFVESPRAGGRYLVWGIAKLKLQDASPLEKVLVSDYVYEQNRLDDFASITPTNWESIVSARPRSVDQRMDRLLLECEAATSLVGERLRYFLQEPSAIFAAASAQTYEEVEYLLTALESRSDIELTRTTQATDVRITPTGYARIAEIKVGARDSAQAFVAMWFDVSMSESYDQGFAPAIRAAGFKPLRVDKKEHANKIDDEIVGEIRRSRFLVADFTCDAGKPRGGVYFEAGLAQGLGLPVIWSCRQESIDDLHFDTRQYNHITWTTPEDLRDALAKRILAVIGEGPLKT